MWSSSTAPTPVLPDPPRPGAQLGRTVALDSVPPRLGAWPDLLVRLSGAPVVSIASIRGRVRGAGSEFVLACDLRFASRENTLLGRFEVGTGLVPGAGPTARLVRLAVVAARSRSSSSPTLSTDRGRSSTGTSTEQLPTTGSTTRWIGSRHCLRAPTTT